VKTAIYARVSTSNGQDPEMQLRELREYCERRGWEIAAEFVDAGVSGAKDSRPELNRLLAEAHRRQFDAVVVWKFDRFARSVSHLLRALETFRCLGMAFQCIGGASIPGNRRNSVHFPDELLYPLSQMASISALILRFVQDAAESCDCICQDSR
jgi:DNA invertase Pin-like site-specific DNA recombinase